MLTFHLIAVGKFKESYWRAAEAEYIKRLAPYARFHIVELAEEPFDAKSNSELIKTREAKKIMAALAKLTVDFTIALDPAGKQFASPDLAARLAAAASGYGSRFACLIGGPLGLGADILQTADLTLSLSPLTFTHQLARVILLEQLYRAMMIKQNRPYHY